MVGHHVYNLFLKVISEGESSFAVCLYLSGKLCAFFFFLFFPPKFKRKERKLGLVPECGEFGMSRLKNGFCIPCIRKFYQSWTVECNDESVLGIAVYHQSVGRWEQRETEAGMSVGK